MEHAFPGPFLFQIAATRAQQIGKRNHPKQPSVVRAINHRQTRETGFRHSVNDSAQRFIGESHRWIRRRDGREWLLKGMSLLELLQTIAPADHGQQILACIDDWEHMLSVRLSARTNQFMCFVESGATWQSHYIRAHDLANEKDFERIDSVLTGEM